MGTCGKPGYVSRDFCLKKGIKFIIFCLNQGTWVPEVFLAEMAAEGRWHCTSGEAARKTSGSERFDLLC